MQKRADHHYFLFHAVRIRAYLVVCSLSQTELLQQLFSALPSQFERNLEHRAHEVEILPARQLFVNGMVVGNVAYGFFRRHTVVGNVHPVHGNSALVGIENTRYQFDCSALSRPVGAEKTENFAVLYIKIEAVHRLCGAFRVSFGYVGQIQHFFLRFSVFSFGIFFHILSPSRGEIILLSLCRVGQILLFYPAAEVVRIQILMLFLVRGAFIGFR